jgi:hypothetical protein
VHLFHNTLGAKAATTDYLLYKLSITAAAP